MERLNLKLKKLRYQTCFSLLRVPVRINRRTVQVYTILHMFAYSCNTCVIVELLTGRTLDYTTLVLFLCYYLYLPGYLPLHFIRSFVNAMGACIRTVSTVSTPW